jgi:hypothetical protein
MPADLAFLPLAQGNFFEAVVVLGTLLATIVAWGLWALSLAITTFTILGLVRAVQNGNGRIEVLSFSGLTAVGCFTFAGLVTIAAAVFTVSTFTAERGEGGLAEFWRPNARDKAWVWMETGLAGAGLAVASIVPGLFGYLAALWTIHVAQRSLPPLPR